MGAKTLIVTASYCGASCNSHQLQLLLVASTCVGMDDFLLKMGPDKEGVRLGVC
jgi:hypothetical protein